MISDDTFMSMAWSIANHSTCSRLNVGAALVKDNRMFAMGYNGVAAGEPHCYHIADEPCARAVHAEANAVVSAARLGASTVGATAYVTHTPCLSCAGMLINAGITRVVWLDTYRSTDGLLRLRDAGLTVDQA